MPDTVAGHAPLDWGVVIVFALVYLGMFLGGLPRLRLDRSGVALLGAIAVIGLGALDVSKAAQAIDLPTILLLFSFMVISAQMRLGGFYTAVALWIGTRPWSRSALLATLVFVAGSLSAVFSNDVICLAMTPIVARVCLARGLAPVPFLVGLTCAANVGSAATLIGNPQNMLIGSVLGLDFGRYLLQAAPPALAGLFVLWLWLVFATGRGDARPALANVNQLHADAPPFDRGQTVKGLVVVTAVLVAFLATDWPHEVVALVAAGVLLLSRRLHSAEVMGTVDWSLLVLFMGLFVVNRAFEQTGLAAELVAALTRQGIVLGDLVPLTVVGVTLSNIVSNVPAVMLLLPHLQEETQGVLLALVSTFAGNLLLVGSIANLIVADLARQQGIEIGWREHARIGIPVTLFTLAIVLLWMAPR
ncbi:MAG: anion transporter [Casimicrobiaceae bacterium]|nr:anion transporter [Casimicrobiaceae bacterium]